MTVEAPLGDRLAALALSHTNPKCGHQEERACPVLITRLCVQNHLPYLGKSQPAVLAGSRSNAQPRNPVHRVLAMPRIEGLLREGGEPAGLAAQGRV